MSENCDRPRPAEDCCQPDSSVHATSTVPLHRLGEARRQERISRLSVACRLGITEAEVRRQERETTDLPLSVLRQWAQVLAVPVAELIQEPRDVLSLPLLTRARMVRVMKTAMAIAQGVNKPRAKRLAQMLAEQLVEIMPELRDVKPWHERGRRRRSDDFGVAFLRRLSARMFCDTEEMP